MPKQNRLETILNRLMHYSTIPVPLHVSVKTLRRITPRHLTGLRGPVTRNSPIAEASVVIYKPLSIFGSRKVDECVAVISCCTEQDRHVNEVIQAIEAFP